MWIKLGEPGVKPLRTLWLNLTQKIRKVYFSLCLRRLFRSTSLCVAHFAYPETSGLRTLRLNSKLQC